MEVLVSFRKVAHKDYIPPRHEHLTVTGEDNNGSLQRGGFALRRSHGKLVSCSTPLLCGAGGKQSQVIDRLLQSSEVL